MRIGTLARLCGTTPRAIRLYEQHGLLSAVARHGRYRHYRAEHQQQIRLIRQALTLGLRLAELPALLRPADGEPDWPAILQRLQQRQQQVDDEILRLQQCASTLAQTHAELHACLAGHSSLPCTAGTPAA